MLPPVTAEPSSATRLPASASPGSLLGLAELLQTPAGRSPREHAPGAAGSPDDLTLVEGIGPKIAGLLEGAGIVRFDQLAAAPVPTLREVLAKAGPRYGMHDPQTWPEQAQLAASGQWQALAELQDSLKGGRRRPPFA